MTSAVLSHLFYCTLVSAKQEKKKKHGTKLQIIPRVNTRDKEELCELTGRNLFVSRIILVSGVSLIMYVLFRCVLADRVRSSVPAVNLNAPETWKKPPRSLLERF